MKLQLSLGFVLSALLVSVQAIPVISSISSEELEAKTAQGLRLLELAEGAAPVWKTEDEKLDIIRSGDNFFDITETYVVEQEIAKVKALSRPSAARATYPAPSKSTLVKPLLAQISTPNMQANLDTLTAFNNRYYKAATGAEASTAILNIVKGYIGSRTDVSAALFSHSFVQSSIIAKIAGTNPSLPITVLGGHMDSINLSNPTSGRAPGADDDGTGSVNLMEAFRVLVQSGWKPTGPVEFHWYAGEEAGLLGSNAIASSYATAGKKINAMLQLDMTAYVKPGTTETIGLITDNVDAGLTEYLRKLITMYLRIGYTSSSCGYGCSDHSSWTRYGFPSSFPFESTFANDNKLIHSAGDTTAVNGFSWAHSLEYAKLAVAFAYELAA